MLKTLTVTKLEALDPYTIRVSISIPQLYVKLLGRLEFSYTNGSSDDVSTWETQVYAPRDDVLATSKLEFDMSLLKPNTLYKIKAKLILRDIKTQPTSEIHSIKTPAEPQLKLSDEPSH